METPELILTDKHEYFLGDRKLDGLTASIKEAGLIRDGDPWYMDRGTAIHKATEFYDRGTLDDSSVAPEIAGYLESWKLLRRDMRYIPNEIECPVYHPELMVATTIDRIPLLDIKSGAVEPWHILQVGFQWGCLRALNRFNNPDFWKNPMDVYLDPDGGPPKVKSYTQAEMREAFRVYSSMLYFIRWRRQYYGNAG